MDVKFATNLHICKLLEIRLFIQCKLSVNCQENYRLPVSERACYHASNATRGFVQLALAILAMKMHLNEAAVTFELQLGSSPA